MGKGVCLHPNLQKSLLSRSVAREEIHTQGLL